MTAEVLGARKTYIRGPSNSLASPTMHISCQLAAWWALKTCICNQLAWSGWCSSHHHIKQFWTVTLILIGHSYSYSETGISKLECLVSDLKEWQGKLSTFHHSTLSLYSDSGSFGLMNNAHYDWECSQLFWVLKWYSQVSASVQCRIWA